MGIFYKRIKEMGVISIISIILFSFGLLIYIQSITEHDIRDNLFLQQKQRQITSTHDISMHIGSDMNLVVGMLDGLANSIYLQQGVYSENAKKLLSEKYEQFKGIVDGLLVLDKNNIVTISYSQSSSESNLGADYSFRGWVVNTRLTLRPVFSDGFERQDTYTIFISYPIISRETGQYIGLIATSIPSVPFFSHYGNLENINTQFLVAYNKYGTMLANGLSRTFVGENFFGNYTQRFIHHNQILNNLTRNLLVGNPGFAVYDYGKGQRLTSDYPIFVNDKPIYFIQLVTPTTEITSQVNGFLFTENTKMFMLLGCTFAAISVLIIFLTKWNRFLETEVKRRTMELNESNNQLTLANEQLKVHDKMQKEFINIAAHELRTPIQPIIGLTQVVCSRIKDREEGQLLGVVNRNAKRLKQLTEDILDVTKIESQSLNLKKEKFNLNDIIVNAIDDIMTNKQSFKIKNNLVKLQYHHPSQQDIFVQADKGRISQVIHNLLDNALKFTNTGTIAINTQIKKKDGTDDENEFIVISVMDTGTGIDPQILPRLFSKFATKSETGGTGLGLFISKSIVEAHGGKMWAENNNNNGEKGATFFFSIPLNRLHQ
jgi:signal transduction histidine kinase